MPVAARYDRQIRLWGETGQDSLSRASVCVIGAGPTATETLKNLVLPGIRSFTIIDGSTASQQSPGNFFVSDGDSFSAADAAASIAELNPSVQGSFISEPVGSFLPNADAAEQFFASFSLIIATQLGTGHKELLDIAEGCYRSNVPLLVVRSYGGLGYIRVQVPELCVRDTKESLAPDLRVARPFPSLLEYCHSVQVASITDGTIAAHVPFVVILIVAVQLFKDRHEGALPDAGKRSDKDELVSIIQGLRPACCPEDAENFAEALKASNLRLCYSSELELSQEVLGLLSDKEAGAICSLQARENAWSDSIGFERSFPTPTIVSNGAARMNANAVDSERIPQSEFHSSPGPCSSKSVSKLRERESRFFWTHVAATRVFVKRYGELPLSGSLPDMISDTESYVTLQKIYQAKADADVDIVFRFVQEIGEERGGRMEYDRKATREFCRYLRNSRAIKYRSIKEELENPSESTFLDCAAMTGALDPSSTNIAATYYPLLRAVDAFYKEHGRHAGSDGSSQASDLIIVREFLAKMKEQLGVTGASLWKEEAHEIIRFASTELHNVAAFMGGIAGQEAVKILTRQFVPLNNTLIFNFANMTCASFAA